MHKPQIPVVLAALLTHFGGPTAIAAPGAAVQDQPVGMQHGDTSLVIRRVWKGEYPLSGMEAPSPDGRYLSAVDWNTGNLMISDSETEEWHRVTDTGSWTGGSMEWAEWSVFSPDGRELAYTWYSDKEGGYGVRIIGVDGSNPRVVVPHSQANAGISVEDWSDDGPQLLIKVLGEDHAWRLMLVSVVDGTARILKTLGERPPQVAVFSPDSRFVAYDIAPDPESSDHDIYALTVEGTQERELVGTNGDDRLMGWTPDGGSILFYSDRELTRGIWRLPVANGAPAGRPELLRADIWQLVPLGFSRDKYFYAVITQAIQVHTATLDIEAGRVVTTSTPVADPTRGTSQGGVWSPDGRQLAYLWQEHGDARWQLAIGNLAGGDTRVMPLPFAQVERLEWVPDSRTIMVFGRYGQHSGLFRFDLRNAEVTPVLSGAEAPDELRAHASFSPDGKTLFFAREIDAGSNRWWLVARELVSGGERRVARLTRSSRQLASGWDLHVSVSPDGRTVAVSEQDPESRTVNISVLPTSGGEAREVYRTARPIMGSGVLCWTPDGRHILFRGVDDQRNMDVIVIPSSGGDPRRIRGVPGFWGFNLHPDGRRFTFNYGGPSQGEIWVIENLP
jgi:Tol biopolymer transport system component